MRGPRTLSILIVAALAAIAVSAGSAATSPLAMNLVLDQPDFAHGGVIVQEGPKLNSSFPHFATSSIYSRDFRNVALGNAELLSLESDVAVAKNPSDPAGFMTSLITVTHSSVGRQLFFGKLTQTMTKALKASSTSVIRARTIHVGDASTDFLFQVHLKTGSIEIGEIWVQVGPTLALIVFSTTGTGVTAGQAVGLANIVATRAKLALEPPPANATLPAIAGTAQIGQVLTASAGTWSGTKPTFAYQWFRCDPVSAACNEIPAATALTYTVGAADEGSTLEVGVTASTPAGSGEARSATTSTIA